MEKFKKFFSFKKPWIYLVVLMAINIIFFLLNYDTTKFFAFVDIPFDELNIGNNLYRTFFMWAAYRGMGMEFGNYIGWIFPLSFKYLLSLVSLSPLQINVIYNFFLFVLPSFSVFYLSLSIFDKHKYKYAIAFISGLVIQSSFAFYILGTEPFFVREWVLIIFPFLIGSIVNYLKHGRARDLVLFLFFTILNCASFINIAFTVCFFGVTAILILALFFNKVYIKKIFLLGVISLLIYLPFIFGSLFFLKFDQANESVFLNQYTSSVENLNSSGIDNSSLLFSFREIGTVNWNLKYAWGDYKYPFYPLFQTPIFVFGSFGYLLIFLLYLVFSKKEKNEERKIIIILSLLWLGLLFLIKGDDKPFGWLFGYLINHSSAFNIFRTPFDKVAFPLATIQSLLVAYAIVFLVERVHKKNIKIFIVSLIVGIYLINAAPLIRGEIFEKVGFFKLSNDYIELSDYINEQKDSGRVLSIPNISYLQLYKNGYFGIGLSAFSFNKSLIEYQYTGSDKYDESYMEAILGEVRFQSGFPTSQNPEPISLNGDEIFSNNAGGCDLTIDKGRVKYFFDLLENANVNRILYDKTVLGTDTYHLTTCDIQRNELLIGELVKENLMSLEKDFGDYQLYKLNYDESLLSLDSGAFLTENEYANYTNSYFSNSDLAIYSDFAGNMDLALIDKDDHSIVKKDYFSEVYIPSYIPEVWNNLSFLNDNFGNSVLGSEDLDKEELDKFTTMLGRGISYYDLIKTAGVYDIYVKTPIDTKFKDIIVDDQVVNDSDNLITKNAWTKIASMSLNAGDFTIKKGVSDGMDVVLVLRTDKISSDEETEGNITEIDPSEYKVTISNLKNNTFLVFKDSYNNGWKINEFSNSDQFHFVANGFANGWIIDPEYIRQNLSKNSYTENPDGSINIELTLYFKPQSYFDISLIVSGTTLFACLGYLGWDFARRRKKKLAATAKEEDV